MTPTPHDSRKAFEAWFAQIVIGKSPATSYTHLPFRDVAWTSWQACHARLLAELESPEMVEAMAKAICTTFRNEDYEPYNPMQLRPHYESERKRYADDFIRPRLYNENGVGVQSEEQHYHYQWRDYVEHTQAALAAIRRRIEG